MKTADMMKAIFRPGWQTRPDKVTGSPMDPIVAAWWGATDNDTGVAVTSETAMKYAPFNAAIRLLSRTVAMLPFVIFKEVEICHLRAKYQTHF